MMRFLSGFMYGETTTMIGGNIQFGGQLQAHTVDAVVYTMETLCIDTISSVEEFNEVVDGIIIRKHHHRELEDLHSDCHHKV